MYGALIRFHRGNNSPVTLYHVSKKSNTERIEDIYNIVTEQDGSIIDRLTFNILPTSSQYNNITPSIKNIISVILETSQSSLNNREYTNSIFFILEVEKNKTTGVKTVYCVSMSYCARWVVAVDPLTSKLNLDAFSSVGYYTSAGMTCIDLLRIAKERMTNNAIINRSSSGDSPMIDPMKDLLNFHGKYIIDWVNHYISTYNLFCARRCHPRTDEDTELSETWKIVRYGTSVSTVKATIDDDDAIISDIVERETLDNVYSHAVIYKTPQKASSLVGHYGTYYSREQFAKANTSKYGAHDIADTVSEDGSMLETLASMTQYAPRGKNISYDFRVNPALVESDKPLWLGQYVDFNTTKIQGTYQCIKIKRCIDNIQNTELEFCAVDEE